MKKFYLIAALSFCTAMAQALILNLSTYGGTDLQKYDGKTCDVSVNRYTITGWNTISLPFAVSEEVLNEVFGSDCRLERLVGVENDGTGMKLNFQNCKAGGIEPNIPYILYYSGETGTKKIFVKDALIVAGESQISYNAQGTGEKVKMACAQKRLDADGLYGVLAKDNAEAKFVNTDAITTGFYATRCYVQLESGNTKTLTTNHIGGDVTNVNQLSLNSNELVDVFSVSGALVAKQIPASQIKNLQKGIYVVNGQTIAVR